MKKYLGTHRADDNLDHLDYISVDMILFCAGYVQYRSNPGSICKDMPTIRSHPAACSTVHATRDTSVLNDVDHERGSDLIDVRNCAIVLHCSFGVFVRRLAIDVPRQ